MHTTGFWWILLATGLYGLIHSLLAANRAKLLAENGLGKTPARRYYRLFFVLMAVVTLLPVVGLVALLPDETIYIMPTPWRWLAVAGQFAAVIGILVTVLQTGAMSFLGISQWLNRDSRGQPRPDRLVVNGLYRYMRHPLYTFSFLLLWLTPIMTWNLMAFFLGLSLYMLIGAYFFEEPKLVEQFGADYEQYRRRTPMLVPFLKIPARH